MVTLASILCTLLTEEGNWPDALRARLLSWRAAAADGGLSLVGRWEWVEREIVVGFALKEIDEVENENMKYDF